MLRLIEGGAKTGKSTRVREELLALARQEDAAPGGLVLLVPEQFSYETEREYFTALGIRRADRVRVLSFQRLAQEIFREYGGLAGETADDSARLLAMKLALQDCKGELALYGPLVRRPDFPGQMVRAMAELKHAAVSPDALEEAAGKAQGFLRDKLADLSLIRNTYETLLGARFRDDEDDLDRAAQLIRENRWFAGKAVWLDGFKSFTAAQEQIIGLMLEQNAQVTAVLSLTSGDSRFSTTEETARRLRTLARKAGARTASPERLTEPRGFADDSLRWFADQALKNSPKPYPGENTGVRCCGLLNEFDEAAFAAAELLRLAKEEGYAYEEMAVLVRDMDRYAPLLEAALDRYGVPYYMDRVESIAVMPLTRFLLHAAGALATGFDRTEVLSFLKCGMTGFSLEELDAFEGYSYVWNISGDGFFTPFRQNPAGYAPREMSAREQEELARAEKVRELCCGLLSGFRRDGEETSWPQAAYRLLLGLELPERMSGWIQERRRQGRQKDADDLERTWSAVMELLNTMETMLTGQKLTPREFRDLFAVCAEGCSLGRIPQTLDSVQVGGADRVRVAGKKAVLLLGVNEGEFPLLPSSEGVFTDKEREELAALGLELTGNQEERILEERFVAWQALSCPSERLTVVYSLGDIAGKPRYPSALVSSFREIFPDTPAKGPGSFPPEFFCRTPRTAFLQYVRSCTDRTVFTASARAFLEETGWQDRLSRLDETLERDRFRLKDPALARELFGGALRISPTQIERFYACRFQYFCQYGLRLKARTRAELNRLSRGSVLHFLLERVLSGDYGDFLGFSDPELKDLLDRLLLEYLEQAMGGAQEKSRQFLYYYRRMSTAALGVFKALRAEFAQTRFVVAGLEEPVGDGGKIPPLTVRVDDRTTVTVEGKIDRVDLFRDGKENYVRIVDYKSGGKEFQLDAMAQGLNLQMLLYLFALWKNGRGEYENATPAGILYIPAGAVKPDLPRNAGEQEQQWALEESYAMNGLLLDDRTVLCAMEPDLSGRFLPVSLGKNGMKGKYLASRQDFENLEMYTEGLIRSMADRLLQGEIGPDPYADGSVCPCNYCDYRAVCGHESRDGFRSLGKTTLEDIAVACESAEKGEPRP